MCHLKVFKKIHWAFCGWTDLRRSSGCVGHVGFLCTIQEKRSKRCKMHLNRRNKQSTEMFSSNKTKSKLLIGSSKTNELFSVWLRSVTVWWECIKQQSGHVTLAQLVTSLIICTPSRSRSFHCHAFCWFPNRIEMWGSRQASGVMICVSLRERRRRAHSSPCTTSFSIAAPDRQEW